MLIKTKNQNLREVSDGKLVVTMGWKPRASRSMFQRRLPLLNIGKVLQKKRKVAQSLSYNHGTKWLKWGTYTMIEKEGVWEAWR